MPVQGLGHVNVNVDIFNKPNGKYEMFAVLSCKISFVYVTGQDLRLSESSDDDSD